MAKKKVIKDVEALEKVKTKEEKVKDIDESVEIEENLADEKIDDNVEKATEEKKVESKEEKKEDKEKEKKKDNKKSDEDKKEKKEGYFTLVNRELKKVVWPKGGEIIKYSLAVILFCVVLCLFFVGIDLIASFVKGLFV